MAKTLMYVPGSPTSVKLGDTDTNLYLQVAKDNVNVDLTSVKSITVKIADSNKNYLKDISIAPANLTSGNNGILTVPLNSDNIDGLNSGDYCFEVWIVTADSETEIYPDMNVTKFHIFNNLVGGTTILTTLTMQAFLDRITANQTASETSLSNSQTALANANAANASAATALSDLNAGNYLTKDTLASAPSFESLQTQVNNSAVGTNLLSGTKNFDSSGNWVGGFTVTTSMYNGLSIAIMTGDWAGVSQYVQVSKGETYTFSTYARYASGTGTSTMLILLNTNPENGYSEANTMPSQQDVNLTADWQRVSVTFTIANDGWIKPRIERTNNTTNQLQVCGFKLEKGSVATDWCPNPSEILTQSDYAKIKAAIVALGGSLS